MKRGNECVMTVEGVKRGNECVMVVEGGGGEARE